MRQMEEAQLRPSGGQQTYDFSTMYTSMKLGNEPDICHDGVKQNMNRYVDLVFEYQKQSTGGRKERGKEKVLMLKHKGLGGWRTRDDASQKDTNNLKYVSADRLKQSQHNMHYCNSNPEPNPNPNPNSITSKSS